MKKVVSYLLVAVLFAAAFYGVRKLNTATNPPLEVVEPLAPDKFDAYMAKNLLPAYDKAARKSVAEEPDLTYVETKWDSASRIVASVMQMDFLLLPENEGLTWEDVAPRADEIREMSRDQMPKVTADGKTAMVDYYCSISSKRAAQYDFQFIKLNGITVEARFLEKNDLMVPYLIQVTATDLEHCY